MNSIHTFGIARAITIFNSLGMLFFACLWLTQPLATSVTFGIPLSHETVAYAYIKGAIDFMPAWIGLFFALTKDIRGMVIALLASLTVPLVDLFISFQYFKAFVPTIMIWHLLPMIPPILALLLFALPTHAAESKSIPK